MKAVIVAALLVTTGALAQERTTIPILDDGAVKAVCTQSILDAARYAKLEEASDLDVLNEMGRHHHRLRERHRSVAVMTIILTSKSATPRRTVS
jgi:hypothetical protein